MSVEFARNAPNAMKSLHFYIWVCRVRSFLYIKKTLSLGETAAIDCALSINIPNGYFGLVSERSIVALKGVVTHVGIIDKDFVGSVKVILTNVGCCPKYSITQGDRIGQITLCKYSKANWIENDSFKAKVIEWNNSTAQDKHVGFGSTGI